MGIVAAVADLSVVNVALPTISNDFDADLPTIQWFTVGYALSISALLMPMGRLSDIVGLRKVYLGGFLVFVVAAVVAMSANSMLFLILSRVLMGAGSAMVQTTSIAILAAVFPAHERGKAMGGMVAMVGLGAAVGPPLGGILISALGWRWVFVAEIPEGLLSLGLAFLILDNRYLRSEAQRTQFDWPGAVLSAGALVSFMLAITSGSRVGWSSPSIIGAAALSVVLAAAFIWWELRSPAPMLELRLFKRRLLTVSFITGFLSFCVAVPSFFLMPFYLQAVLGFEPKHVGLIILPNALAMTAAGALGGWFSDRFGPMRLMVAGQVLIAAGAFLVATLTIDSPLGLVMSGMLLIRAGSGMFESSNASSILGGVERENYGVISAFLNLVRNGSIVIALAMSIAIVTATMNAQGYAPNLGSVESDAARGLLSAFTEGMRTVFLILGFGVLAGTVVLLSLGRTPKAKPTPNSGIHLPHEAGKD